MLAGGTVVQGANVENAAYPVGTCAERVGIATAVVQVSLVQGMMAWSGRSNVCPGCKER